MKKLKSIIKITAQVLGIIAWCLGCLFCWEIGKEYGVSKAAQTQPQDKLPTIEEIQKRIGAEPDGILGPETQRCWQMATYSTTNPYKAREIK